MSFTLKRVDLHKPTATWYSEYLQSDKWKAFRAAIIAERGELCEICKIRPHFSLHHKTYARLFNELPEDVILVCKECHKEEHAKYKIPWMGLIYEESIRIVKIYLNSISAKLSKQKPQLR